MTQFSKKTFFVFILTVAAGIGLHFLYDILPNPVTALVSPVTESLAEHLKILIWPYLLGLVILGKRDGFLGERMLALLVICGLMLAIGYLYHVVLGGTSVVFSIALYVGLLALGFWLPHPLSRLLQGRGGQLLLALVLALVAATLLFTFLPPDHIFYADLSGVNTWSVIPC